MPNIETIVRQVNRELVPQFEEKLRAYLSEQDRKRQERSERVRALGL